MDINIDGSAWGKIAEFYDDLLIALGSPDGHGKSIDALIDSMIWGGMNAINPPYQVRILNTSHLRVDILDHLRLAIYHLAETRKEFRDQEGHDVKVEMELVGEPRS